MAQAPTSSWIWEDALSSSGCPKVLPTRENGGQKGTGAEDNIGLALFSLHSCSQQLCLNWLVPFSAFVLLYRNKSSTRTNRNCSCCASVRKEQPQAFKKNPNPLPWAILSCNSSSSNQVVIKASGRFAAASARLWAAMLGLGFLAPTQTRLKLLLVLKKKKKEKIQQGGGVRATSAEGGCTPSRD